MYWTAPNWLEALRKRYGNWGLPNLIWYILVLQIFGMLVIYFIPTGYNKLILDPKAVIEGKEFWRVLTFLAVPIAGDFWIIFALWFLYFVVQSLEAEWGEFYTTFYLAISVLLTIVFSFFTGITISSPEKIYYSLFLAAASLFPEQEVMLFFLIPLAMKWLGLIGGIFLIIDFFNESWYGRLYLLLVFLNYFLFFGKHGLDFVRNLFQRR
ncbi:MAG: hypothetical protein NZM25_08525 [Leptospiraceae bacterium]|nr:hypothetical protein [Leptospiraceae bacterium]MDW8306762.1 hypothetical protein [Leptospiraceae bacterium]